MKIKPLFIVTLIVISSLGTLVSTEVKGQEVFNYDVLVKASWKLDEFNARYHRSTIKGTSLLFSRFLLGKLIHKNGSSSEILFFNYDTVRKNLFTRRPDRQRITNETHYHSIDSLIVFETATTDQKVFLRLEPEAFQQKRPYPTFYEALTRGNYVLLKETVMAFIKATKGAAAYDQSEDRTDHYLPVVKYYLTNSEGLYQVVKLSKRSVLSALKEEDRQPLLRLAKENGLRWKGEAEIAQMLMKLNNR